MTATKRARKSVPRMKGLQSETSTAGPASLEAAANEISARIREVHMVHGTLMDPIFASPESDQIISYTHTGDSAIWTGHFLAAEAFHSRVTGSDAALDNVKAALSGLRDLVDITGGDILARIAAPVDSPYAAAIQKEEGGHGVFQGRLRNADHFWIGNTTRDQYAGVIFGLGAALELVTDDKVRRDAASLVGRLVGYLDRHAWTVRMPNDKISTTFLQRPDQQLAFLQVARQASASDFGSRYRKASLILQAVVSIPVLYDNLDDHHSYFKFNLNTIVMYILLRYESTKSLAWSAYVKTYNKLRQVTQNHQNAHFNMIDHAIKGPNKQRDDETVRLLNEWLERPRRDPFVDLRGQLPAVGDDRARDVIPVPKRPTTDFLWQRSPFLLYGGGVGLVENAGIDFILPYWMGRHFGIIEA